MRSSTIDVTLLATTEQGVRTLALNRPAKRNAIDPELRDALAEAIDGAANDAAVRGVVLSGEGGAFCAGGDLGRFDELHEARANRHVAHGLIELMNSIERLEKPVVAAIGGAVAGAGLALALACNWRVGSPSARLMIELTPADGTLLELAHSRVEPMLARAPLSYAAAKRLLQLAADADQQRDRRREPGAVGAAAVR
jgi:enoyl-CoA hydratase/carnithine racemase